jgi:serine/threonine-protein kinase
VRESIDQRLRGVPAEDRRTHLFWRRQMALLEGDFVSAESLTREHIEASKGLREEDDHAPAAFALVRILTETGRFADAAQVAQDFLGREASWLDSGSRHNVAITEDFTVRMLKVALAGGALTRDAYESKRREWLDRWNERVNASFRSYLWISGYAWVATTKDEAAEAMKELPKLGPLPPDIALSPSAAQGLGQVYAAAEQHAEALKYLTRVTSGCGALLRIHEDTRAHALLAGVLEQTGDVAGACRENAVVLGRWGNAKPRSITAEDARARAAKLGCR